MPRLRLRLEEWRAAERRRDRWAPRTPVWREADHAVRLARLRYHAEGVRVRALYEALEHPAPTGTPHHLAWVDEGAHPEPIAAIWSALMAALPAR
jgi:hypothetical protein